MLHLELESSGRLGIPTELLRYNVAAHAVSGLPVASVLVLLRPKATATDLTGDLELRGSKMKLQMDLLHEGDLLNFLNDLKRKGFYTVQECKVKRAGAESESAHLPLAAECFIYWLTLGERVGSPEPTPQ